MANPGQPVPRRRLRPFHVVIIAVLVVAAGVFAFEGAHVATTAGGKGPPAEYNAPRTTRQEAEAKSQGQGRDGANSSDESYTAQNQSRPPPSERP